MCSSPAPSTLFQAGPVDVHAHATPAFFPENAAGEARWPCMHRRSATDATISMGDKPFRQLDDRSWEVGRRLADMDRDGIAVQVLSPMPELLSYWFDPQATELLCDAVNADLARKIAEAPSRFSGLGMIPLQDIDLALRHLERVKSEYGLAGIEIGSNINGVMLGDARWDPLFEAAQDLGLAIFVHALHPLATKALDAHPAFAPMIGFPVDTAMAAASMLMAGTLDRYPRLRVGFSHGGGALMPLLHRLDFGWAANGFGGTVANLPSQTAARMFFDSNVYAPQYLRYITEHLAPGRIFLGTDYPYPIMQTDPVAFVDRAGLSAEARDALLWGAAYEFLDVKAAGRAPGRSE